MTKLVKRDLIDLKYIAHAILILRGQRVILDRDLAVLYGVTTKRFNEAVKRNAARFPEDFMFQLTAEEASVLRSQFATSKTRSTDGRGSVRYRPFAASLLKRVTRDLPPRPDIDLLAGFVMKRHPGQHRFQELNRKLPGLGGINAIDFSILPEESRRMNYARVFVCFLWRWLGTLNTRDKWLFVAVTIKLRKPIRLNIQTGFT